MKKVYKRWIVPILLCGCTSTVAPRVDMTGVDPVRYEADLRDCQSYAAKAKNVGGTSAEASVTGGVLGAAINVAAGAGSIGVAATSGAISSGILTGAREENLQNQQVRSCLDRLGYNLLD